MNDILICLRALGWDPINIRDYRGILSFHTHYEEIIHEALVSDKQMSNPYGFVKEMLVVPEEWLLDRNGDNLVFRFGQSVHSLDFDPDNLDPNSVNREDLLDNLHSRRVPPLSEGSTINEKGLWPPLSEEQDPTTQDCGFMQLVGLYTSVHRTVSDPAVINPTIPERILKDYCNELGVLSSDDFAVITRNGPMQGHGSSPLLLSPTVPSLYHTPDPCGAAYSPGYAYWLEYHYRKVLHFSRIDQSRVRDDDLLLSPGGVIIWDVAQGPTGDVTYDPEDVAAIVSSIPLDDKKHGHRLVINTHIKDCGYAPPVGVV